MSRLPNLPYHRHLVQITPNSFASAAYTVHDMRTYAKAAVLQKQRALFAASLAQEVAP